MWRPVSERRRARARQGSARGTPSPLTVNMTTGPVGVRCSAQTRQDPRRWRPPRQRRSLDRMISWLAAFAAVLLAAAATPASSALSSSAHGSTGDVRIEVLSVTPRPPRAAQPFALVARVEFAPSPGSIRCNVWIGGKRFRDIRLVWDDPTARCYFRLPAGARGKRLTVGLAAMLGGSLTRTTLAFRVS